MHLFSGLHYIAGTPGPTRVMTTGGLRYWKDGRDVPDVMLGLYDYAQGSALPAFNLTLKVDFADGARESSGFRFVGSEGVMTVGSELTITRKARPKEPGYTIGTFPKSLQETFLNDYREKSPPGKPQLEPTSEESYRPPTGYSDSLDHFTNFFESVRSRSPLVEDAVFGLRAAGPALLSNLSYFENRPYGWDPDHLKVKGDAHT